MKCEHSYFPDSAPDVMCGYNEDVEDRCDINDCPKIKDDLKKLPTTCINCATLYECHFNDAEFKIKREVCYEGIL